MKPDTSIVGFHFEKAAGAASSETRTANVVNQSGAARLATEQAKVVWAKAILVVDAALISLFRVDLEGQGDLEEPPDATPLFAGSFTPPAQFDFLTFILGYGYPDPFAWRPSGAGRSQQAYMFQPLARRDDARWISCTSTVRMFLRESGPAPSVGWTMDLWLRLQWDCDCRDGGRGR